MFQQPNEFKYTAATGKIYIIYLLKFWQADDKKDDYLIKYEIRSDEKDIYWYGRISRERALLDLKISPKDRKSVV